MADDPPNSQRIRSININNLAPAPPHPAEVVYIDTYTNTITKKEFILLDLVLVNGGALEQDDSVYTLPPRSV
ncbi:hypothetical protein BGZ96_008583 [Linnemannia gamsii]|uniref:Uncharacterized protein n=1 Tax=Linnemannia gamsii TaxID=64522 RepID=A0ABQ7JY53_9FUNG|nr:hypothetical protein BGZ96_008583 [Linnemannia gamsii]